jgi:hypothetical protein
MIILMTSKIGARTDVTYTNHRLQQVTRQSDWNSPVPLLHFPIPRTFPTYFGLACLPIGFSICGWPLHRRITRYRL